MTDTVRLEDQRPVGVRVIPTYALALWWARKQEQAKKDAKEKTQ